MEPGWEGVLNDRGIPQHWPLKWLLFSGACGEVFQTHFVLERRVNHLILLLNSSLTFEGPTSKEICDEHDKAIARGDAEYFIMNSGRAEE